MIAPFFSADQLAAALDATLPTYEGRPLVVVDSRWYLDGRSGEAAYRQGHVPGAVWIDLERWLAGHGEARRGRHPLPSAETFAEGMGRHGISADTVVVVYDDQAGLVAGRLVWMLRRLGHDAALLDGGLAAWPGPLAEGDGEAVPPCSFPIKAWPSQYFVDTADVIDRAASTRLIDARAAERYRGETEPIDPQAGHIPGARSLPLTGNLGPTGRFLSVAELTARFAPLLTATEATPNTEAEIISYCGSGVSACHNLLALEACGWLGRLYVGSWSAWSSTPGLPVATGAPD